MYPIIMFDCISPRPWTPVLFTLILGRPARNLRISTAMPLRSPRPLVAFSAIACAVVLAGCSSLLPQGTPGVSGQDGRSVSHWRDAISSASRISTRTARGRMHFVCSYDAKGFYWRFSHPSGGLYRGNTKVGTLTSDWSITASDGTTLKMSVLTNGPRRSAEDLTDAVFKASAPKKGTFAGVRYVERTNTRGGMPLTKCSASQQGQRLSRPFEADYTFWR